MILTEMYFSKSTALPKERQALEETLAEAQSVLKDAHNKGVELEFILEVRQKSFIVLTCTLCLCITCSRCLNSCPNPLFCYYRSDLVPFGAGLPEPEPPFRGSGGKHSNSRSRGGE